MKYRWIIWQLLFSVSSFAQPFVHAVENKGTLDKKRIAGSSKIKPGIPKTAVGHPANDQFLLSGTWKFSTIYGNGAINNSVNESSKDIVIDNGDTRQVEVRGNWKTSTGEKNAAPFVGKDYLKYSFKTGDTTAYVRYKGDNLPTGYYECFVQYPYATHLTTRYNVKHALGKTYNHINQRVRNGQWVSLGIFKFIQSNDNYIEVTAITGGEVSTDGVMFRPVSEADVLKAIKLEQTVFLPEYNDGSWAQLAVPGHWGMLNQYSSYTGKGWYRKSFELPAGWSSKSDERIRLKFDAVYHVARVFLNGKFIGMHRGGFTPFEFDVTNHLNDKGRNMLAVEADNNFLVGATYNWGGIIRDVHLVKNKDVRINYQYVHAAPDLKTGKAILQIKVRVENNSSANRSLTLFTTIAGNEKNIKTVESPLLVSSNSVKEFIFSVNLEAKDVALWHFDRPYLYYCSSVIKEGDNELHNRTDKFGIRKIEITATQFLLNGEPVRLAGFNRVSDHRYWGSSEPQLLINQDVDLMKNAGANFMRIMHGTQNEKLIARCDEKGILLFEEVNVRELSNPEFVAPDYTIAKQWLKEMIERDCNHASIVGWSVGNELHDHFDYAQKMIAYVKSELDSYRLVTCVSNTGYSPAYTPATDANSLVDIIMHNYYPFQGTFKNVLDAIHNKWPDKPVFISEFGAGVFPDVSLDNDWQPLADFYDNIRLQNNFVIGASLWTFNDYRSMYAGTSEEENRIWGAVNAWRSKRRFYSTIQKENSPVKDFVFQPFGLNDSSTTVSITLKGKQDFPSYTLSNYKLAYTFKDRYGKIVNRNQVPLPVLTPGGKEWSGQLNWGRLPPYTTACTMQLLAPTGYATLEKTIHLAVPGKPLIASITPGDSNVRINYKPVPGAIEYYVVYKDRNGRTNQTAKTIGFFVDVNNLSNNQTYNFSLLAINEMGESAPSKVVTSGPNGKTLPPVTWDAFIANHQLVVGYSAQKGDEVYTVQYGQTKAALNKEFKSKTRGMLTVPLPAAWRSAAFRLKVKGVKGESNWSDVMEIKNK